MKDRSIYGQSLGFDESLDAIEPVNEVKYVPTKFYECPRCKQTRPQIGLCPTCPEFDKKLCHCGHTAEHHSFVKGPRTGREIDICGRCLGCPKDNKSKPGYICDLFVEVKENKEQVA